MVIDTFEHEILNEPQAFCIASQDIEDKCRNVTKYLLDPVFHHTTGLKELYIHGFDLEQIWQQLNLKNLKPHKKTLKSLRKQLRSQDSSSFFKHSSKALEEESEESATEEESDVSEEEQEGSEKEDSEDASEKEDSEEDAEELSNSLDRLHTKPQKMRKKPRDEVEDGFFDWDEMEAAAEEEEKSSDEEEHELLYQEEDEEEDASEEEEDIDNDDPEEVLKSGTKLVKFQDFYDENNNQPEEEEEEEGLSEQEEILNQEEEEDLAERGVLRAATNHQKQQAKVSKQIESLEREALSEKAWEMKGEVKSSSRPENSLLEATLEYDRPTKVAPVITPETTATLEDLIRSRIGQEQFDNVVPRRGGGGEEEALKQKSSIAADVSTEKSKLGLGDLYAADVMAKDNGPTVEQQNLEASVQTAFDKLCWKLDALSNFHFTPKPVFREASIDVNRAPAISMEDKVPMSVSQADCAAPEVVYHKKRNHRQALVQSREEMSKGEKQSLRNHQKSVKRRRNQQVASQNRLQATYDPKMRQQLDDAKMAADMADNKNIVQGSALAHGESKQFSKSSEFFANLQQQVDNATSGGDTGRKKTKSDTGAKFNAAALKL